MKSKPRTTLNSIQALRAVAAVLVVVFHSLVHLDVRGLIADIPYGLEVGRSGVDIFFVISGFIMVYVTRDAFGRRGASADFMIKRAIRIIPVYWFYTFALAGLMLLAPGNVSGGKSVQLQHLVYSLAFISWPNNVGDLKPVLQVGWTLNYEMYFYAVVATLLVFSRRYFLSAMTAVFVSSAILGVLFPVAFPPAKVLVSPLLLEFLMGCAAAVLYFSRDSIPAPRLLALLGCVGLIATMAVDTSVSMRWLKWGVPGFFLVTGLVFWEKSLRCYVPRLLVVLGGSSYSLYLTHIFSINGLGFIWHRFIGGYYVLFVFSAIVVSVVVGHCAFVLVEQPVSRYLTARDRASAFRRKLTAGSAG